MDKKTFLKSFCDACTIFKKNECVKFVSESSTMIVTYGEMESMTEEIRDCYERTTFKNQCIGIVCNDLHPQIIAIMMG